MLVRIAGREQDSENVARTSANPPNYVDRPDRGTSLTVIDLNNKRLPENGRLVGELMKGFNNERDLAGVSSGLYDERLMVPISPFPYPEAMIPESPFDVTASITAPYA